MSRVLLGLFQRALCLLGALMCPLGLPQNKQCALWLHLKTNIFLTATWTSVWALNIELSEHWTELKCFVDSGTHSKKMFGTDNHSFKIMDVVMKYYLYPLACKFWSENTVHEVSSPRSIWHEIVFTPHHINCNDSQLSGSTGSSSIWIAKYSDNQLSILCIAVVTLVTVKLTGCGYEVYFGIS